MALPVILLIGILFLLNSVHFSQEIDPFYFRLFQEGEKSFLAGSYKEAAKELEIAIFGLNREKELKVKTYAYLSLGYYHLKNREKSQEYLRKASDLLGEEGFEGIDINESVQSDLEKLLVAFRKKPAEVAEEFKRALEEQKETVKESKKAIEEPESKIKESKKPIKKPDKKAEEQKPVYETQLKKTTEIKSLPEETPKELPKQVDERMKDKPHNISMYYELYEHYMKTNNLRFAKRVLKTLVKQNPSEVYAYFLIAKVEFYQKEYKDALQNYNKVLSSFNETQVDKELVVKSMIYASVCLYNLDKKEHIATFIKDIKEFTTEEQLMQFLKE